MRATEDFVVGTVALCIFLTLLFLVFLAVYWTKPIVRASSRPFMLFICLGSCLVIVSILLPITTLYSCVSDLWVEVLAFNIVFGPFFIKNWNLHMIFNAKKLSKSRGLRSPELLLGMGCILFPDLVALALATASQPYLDTVNVSEKYYVPMCVGEYLEPIRWCIFGFHIVLCIWGAYIAFRVRNVRPLFNESVAMSGGVYGITLVAVLMVPVRQMLHGNPNAILVFRCILNFGGYYGPLCFLFMSKFLERNLNHMPDKSSTNFKASGSFSTKRARSSSNSSQASSNNSVARDSSLETPEVSKVSALAVTAHPTPERTPEMIARSIEMSAAQDKESVSSNQDDSPC